MYPDMFENGDFSLSLRNNTRPHVAYSIRFRPTTQKHRNKQWKYDSILHKACVMLIAYGARSKSSYSKTSIFVRPHVNEKQAFSKISLWRALFKRCVFRDLFHRIRVDGRLNRREKSPF